MLRVCAVSRGNPAHETRYADSTLHIRLSLDVRATTAGARARGGGRALRPQLAGSRVASSSRQPSSTPPSPQPPLSRDVSERTARTARTRVLSTRQNVWHWHAHGAVPAPRPPPPLPLSSLSLRSDAHKTLGHMWRRGGCDSAPSEPGRIGGLAREHRGGARHHDGG